jgi:hypothetical protein
MKRSEYRVGDDTLMVLYVSDDSANEVDAKSLWAEVASDADNCSAQGWRPISTTALPLRHAGTPLGGLLGSGYTTKVAVTVTYARR